MDEADHALLRQILTVAPNQEKWAGAAADKPIITRNQTFLGRAVPGCGQAAKRLVGWGICGAGMTLNPLMHQLLYLFSLRIVKQNIKFFL
jgi:hypothetical protein